MNSLEDTFDHDRVLIFGIGGSGDIVGCVPTARLLEQFDTEVILGGVTWEPVPYDSRPGPRSLDEVTDMERLNESVGLVTKSSQTSDGLVFTESHVAGFYDQNVMLIDMHEGVRGMTRDLDDACNQLDIDAVIGVDAGGDALARGDEPGLRSPVIDGYGITTLRDIDRPSCLGIFGYGSDGELSIDEIESAITRAASQDGLLGSWGITMNTRDEMDALLDVVDTEASRLPVQAAKGETGRREIRGGNVTVDLRAPSTVTFYFDPETITAYSEISDLIRDSWSLDEATTALESEGYLTEFEIERQRLAKGQDGDN